MQKKSCVLTDDGSVVCGKKAKAKAKETGDGDGGSAGADAFVEKIVCTKDSDSGKMACKMVIKDSNGEDIGEYEMPIDAPRIKDVKREGDEIRQIEFEED